MFGGARLHAEATVVTGEGAVETAKPAGSPMPEVLGWLNGSDFTSGPDFEPSDDDIEIEVLVVPVADAALDIAVEVARP